MKKSLTLLISLLIIIPIYCIPTQEKNPLFTAAREGNITEIKQALDDYADCSIKDDEGNTLLHIAASNGHENIIDALTAYRGWWQYYINGPTLPTIDEKNNKGDSPLESAIRNGKHGVIAYFHTKQKLQKTDDDQIRALCACIDSDDQNSLNLLHFYDYNLFLKNKSDYNLLYYAIQRNANKKKSIQFLAQYKELINSRDNNLNTPLLCAMAYNQPDEETIKLLIDSGADVTIKNNRGTAPIHLAKTSAITDYLLCNKANIDEQDLEGNTPLLLNIKRNNTEMVNYLIQKNANVKKCNKDGETAFMIATIYGHQNIYDIIAQHPDTNINYKDHKGETALHKASKHGLIEKAAILMHKSPSLTTIPDKNGNIPIMTATICNQKELVKYLIPNSLLNTTNNNDENMLDLAAELQDSTLLTLLIPYFPREIITRQNKDGLTLAHHVAKSGGIANAHITQHYNLAYSQRTHKGNTCVHIAAHHNNIAMLRLLKENNEDFDARNYNQETPLMKAALANSSEAVQFILSEKHYINRDVEKIIELLKQNGKKNSKVCLDLQQQHDNRLSRCKKIINEYPEINKIIAQNQSSEFSIIQKRPAYSVMLSQHITATPHYKSAEQLYATPEEEWAIPANHYRECKDHELDRQNTLNKILNDIHRQEEQERAIALRREIEEAARRAAIAEQQKRELEKANMERRKQKEAAQHAAAIAEQQKRADAERHAREKEAARDAAQPKPDNPPQPISDHDRQVWAQKNIDLFKQSFKKEHGKKNNNNFTQKDIHELEKYIKESTTSHTNISAEDGEKHIHNGIILFLNKKLEAIKQELHNSNKYRAYDIEIAIQKTHKEITNAITRLKQPTYEKLAELLGDNNSDKESNIMKRVINNIGIN